MPDGDILHPLNEDDIIHVPVLVDRVLGDGKPVAEYPTRFRLCIAHGSNENAHRYAAEGSRLKPSRDRRIPCNNGWVPVCHSFGFARLSRRREVNNVEPREDACEYRPQDRTIPVPGTHNSYR